MLRNVRWRPHQCRMARHSLPHLQRFLSKEIKKGRPYQNYREAAFGVQRRMADWSFEKAHTWEDLLAAHDKWMTDYNFQKHMAHEERQDGCHSPAAVLGWVKGMQPEPELVHQVFEAICETRHLNKALLQAAFSPPTGATERTIC